MKDAQKPDHVSLATIVGRLREGQYVIPDFQREFEWKPWDIRELMRSIFLDYYIGSLLLWKGTPESFKALACEPLYGFEGDGDTRYIVLDGQQRLTAMYYAFLAPDVPAPSRQNRFLYFIRVDKFMDEVYEEAFEYDWTQRGVSLLADKTSQFENHRFSLTVVGKDGFELAFWVRDYEQYWKDKEAKARGREDVAATWAAGQHAKNAHEFGQHLNDISQKYQVSYIELDQDIEIEKVCDIFTQINSRGIRLDVFDLINALLKPKGLQLKHLWRVAAPRLDFVDTERMNVYILQVMSILSQAYCSQSTCTTCSRARKRRYESRTARSVRKYWSRMSRYLRKGGMKQWTLSPARLTCCANPRCTARSHRTISPTSPYFSRSPLLLPRSRHWLLTVGSTRTENSSTGTGRACS